MHEFKRFCGNTTYPHLHEYKKQVLDNPTQEDLEILINKISTNYTFFYREKAHFEFLQKTALPNLVELAKKHKRKELRVWCAAASTGEEPYTLAMILREYFAEKYGLWDTGVLATDISKSALEKALSRDLS